MSRKIRVGIVGTSWYADWMHLPAIRSHPQVELAAICGRNLERAKEMAKKYEVPQVFSDHREMIEKAGIDALIVAVPDDLHCAVTLAALDAGLHVLCEKPLAHTLEQASEMYTRAEQAGVRHMTYFTWRWLPAFRYVQRLIQEGYVGRHYDSLFRYVGGYARDAQYAWRWDPQHGSGVLGDLGSHMIDLARWFIGDVAKVSAKLSTVREHPGAAGQKLDAANDSASLALQFEDGSQGLVQVSAVAHVGNHDQDFQVVLYGEGGTLQADFNFEDGYVVRGARSDEEEIRQLRIPDDILQGVDQDWPISEQLDRVFREQSVGSRLFIDAIADGRAISPSFYDGYKAQEVIEAAIEADQRECWVSLKVV